MRPRANDRHFAELHIHQLWELVDLLCAETAAAIDEMTNILRRNLRDLHACAGRGETPPLEERLRYKFQSTEVTRAARCSPNRHDRFPTGGGG
jgi:hypothetical protein